MFDQLDVNGDGVVNPVDAYWLFSELNTAGSEGVPKTGDLSGDGMLTPRDALVIVNHLRSSGTLAGRPVMAAAMPRDDGKVLQETWASVDRQGDDDDGDARRSEGGCVKLQFVATAHQSFFFYSA